MDSSAQTFFAGQWLDFEQAKTKLTGELSAEAKKLCVEEYAAGFELPEV